LAEVSVCGDVFKSCQVKTKKVDAEQDAAKLAFEHLEQQDQQHNGGASAASKSMILIRTIRAVEVAVHSTQAAYFLSQHSSRVVVLMTRVVNFPEI